MGMSRLISARTENPPRDMPNEKVFRFSFEPSLVKGRHHVKARTGQDGPVHSIIAHAGIAHAGLAARRVMVLEPSHPSRWNLFPGDRSILAQTPCGACLVIGG